jgi:hypothetical protein
MAVLADGGGELSLIQPQQKDPHFLYLYLFHDVPVSSRGCVTVARTGGMWCTRDYFQLVGVGGGEGGFLCSI